MGTVEQKKQLASDVLGVTAEVVTEVFKTAARSLPCIYLFSLGTVENLRKSMKISSSYSDDMIIYKYGYTVDLVRRTKEHNKTYGEIDGVELKLKYHSYIDPMYCSKAETEIKNFFIAIDSKLKYKDHVELIAVTPKINKILESQYKHISEAYSGHVKDLIKEVEDLKKELELQKVKHEYELLITKNELLLTKNQLNMANAQVDTIKKDLEIERLRNQLLIKSNKK